MVLLALTGGAMRGGTTSLAPPVNGIARVIFLAGRFIFRGYWKSMEPWNKCVWCSGGHCLAIKPFLVFVATWAPNAVYAAKVHLLPISPSTL